MTRPEGAEATTIKRRASPPPAPHPTSRPRIAGVRDHQQALKLMISQLAHTRPRRRPHTAPAVPGLRLRAVLPAPRGCIRPSPPSGSSDCRSAPIMMDPAARALPDDSRELCWQERPNMCNYSKRQPHRIAHKRESARRRHARRDGLIEVEHADRVKCPRPGVPRPRLHSSTSKTHGGA